YLVRPAVLIADRRQDMYRQGEPEGSADRVLRYPHEGEHLPQSRNGHPPILAEEGDAGQVVEAEAVAPLDRQLTRYVTRLLEALFGRGVVPLVQAEHPEAEVPPCGVHSVLTATRALQPLGQ